MIGTTVHVLSGTRYRGAYDVAECVPAAEHPAVVGNVDGWLAITDRRGAMTTARPEDLFDTEEEARAEVRRRRKPRRKRQPRPLYGDLAYVAALNGIRTDGSGRKA